MRLNACSTQAGSHQAMTKQNNVSLSSFRTSPTIRVGMPLVSGELLDYGIASGLPLMFSANAFARLNAVREFTGFRIQAAAAIPEHVDAALDSAGFVAASIYGDYRWDIDSYLDLAAARPWTFYSTMDYCVEAQVAPDAATTRRLRVDATIARYFQCANRAAQRGLKLPMPVLQGRFADEYARCAEEMGITAATGLVGIGSVCRRHLHGPDGVLAIIQQLDEMLPSGVKLHFFGLKGRGPLAALLQEFPHRLGGTDSMAYDMGVRRACPVGRTQFMRAQAMVECHAREVCLLRQAVGTAFPRLPAPARNKDVGELVAEAVGKALGGLHRTDDVSYADAKHLLAQDTATVMALMRAKGPAAFNEPDPDDDFGLGVVYESVREALVEEGYLGVT